MLVDILICLLGVSLVFAQVDNSDVKIVHVERFDGDMQECRDLEVCADVFNFTRTLEDGSRQRESRFIQNCRCKSGIPCGGRENDQLIFKETQTQSMITCEQSRMFTVCGEGEVAKEQHNLGNYVFYRINCVCPNNENPQGFFNKMTVRTYLPGYGGRRNVRLFRCRSGY